MLRRSIGDNVDLAFIPAAPSASLRENELICAGRAPASAAHVALVLRDISLGADTWSDGKM
jgi:hypothetical protein